MRDLGHLAEIPALPRTRIPGSLLFFGLCQILPPRAQLRLLFLQYFLQFGVPVPSSGLYNLAYLQFPSPQLARSPVACFHSQNGPSYPHPRFGGHKSPQPATHSPIHSPSFLSLPLKSKPSPPSSTISYSSRPCPTTHGNPDGPVTRKRICLRNGRLKHSIWPRCHQGGWYGFCEHEGEACLRCYR